MDLHLHQLDQGHEGIYTVETGMEMKTLVETAVSKVLLGDKTVLSESLPMLQEMLGNGDVPSATDIGAVTDG